MILAVLGYFTLAALVGALFFLPGARSHAAGWVQRARHAGVTRRRAAARHGRQHFRAVAGGIQKRSRSAWHGALRHHRALAASGALLLAAPLLALALRGYIDLDGYDHRISREADPTVQALLAGEQLVPPAAVPPEWFTTPEVQTARPQIARASRQWELLDAEFRQRLLVVFKLMLELHGVEMVLLEGYRSPERQTRLAEMGPQVTRARAFESWHQYGLAADCAFVRDGRIVIAETDPWAARSYALYGEVARSVGLTWGGGWRRLKDFGHVEWPRRGLLKSREAAEEPSSPQLH